MRLNWPSHPPDMNTIENAWSVEARFKAAKKDTNWRPIEVAREGEDIRVDQRYTK